MAEAEQADIVRLFLEHRDQLFAFMLSMVHDWDVAEELFQEMSVVLLSKKNMPEELQYPKAWFREMARRCILNYWKREKRKRLFFSEKTLDIVAELYEKEPPERARQELPILRKCISQLTERMQRLLQLRYTEKWPIKKVAEEFNKSPGSIQVSLSRLRSQLLKCMKREGAAV